MVEDKPVIRELSRAAKIWRTLRHLTVVPLFSFYLLGLALSALATKNLNLDKACRVNLGFNETLCAAMLAKEEENDQYCETYLTENNVTGPDPWRNAICNYEEASQMTVTSMDTWRSFIVSFFNFVIVMFVGSWMDRHMRRKPGMIVPICGEVVTNVGLLLCTYFFYQLPMEVTGLVDSLIPSLAGGSMTVNAALYSYVGATTSVEDMTLRIGIVNVCLSVSSPVGTSLSGHIYRWIGYYGVFLVTGSMHLLAIIWGWKMIKEQNTDEGISNTIAFGDRSNIRLFSFLRDFFDITHVRETVLFVFKKRKGNYRLKVILLMIGLIVVTGPLIGDYGTFSD